MGSGEGVVLFIGFGNSDDKGGFPEGVMETETN
jgi:hypothetical protein